MPAQRTSRQYSHGVEPYPRSLQQVSSPQQSQLADGRRGPWAPAEDELLKSLVAQHGAGNWVAIQNGIKSRSAKQCRERWHQNLDAKLRHDPITPEEGEEINRLVALHGKCWANIARQLKGRSDNAVKNWWNGGENRRKREEARLQQQMVQSHSHAHPYPNYPAQPYYHGSPVVYQQGPPPPPPVYPHSQVAGPQLAPLRIDMACHGLPAPLPVSTHGLARIQRFDIPAPLHIHTGPIERSQPSPAGSVPSMIMDDPASPRSYGRRDSIQAQTPQVQTPITHAATSMIRVSSNDRHQDSFPFFKPEIVEKRIASAEYNTTLPPIQNLINTIPGPRAPRGMEGLFS